MKTIHIARSALAVAITVALAGATAAPMQAVAPYAPSPNEITDARATDSSMLLLRSGLIDPLVERVDYSSTGAAADVQSGRYGIVQFEGDPAAARARLEKQGIQFLGYVPNNAYQVRLDGAALTTLKSDAAVRWVDVYQPGQKLDPALWTAALDALPQAPEGGYEIDVFGFSGQSADRLAAALLKVSGVRVLSVAKGDVPFARAYVDRSNLAELIRRSHCLNKRAFVSDWNYEVVGNLKSKGYATMFVSIMTPQNGVFPAAAEADQSGSFVDLVPCLTSCSPNCLVACVDRQQFKWIV